MDDAYLASRSEWFRQQRIAVVGQSCRLRLMKHCTGCSVSNDKVQGCEGHPGLGDHAISCGIGRERTDRHNCVGDMLF